MRYLISILLFMFMGSLFAFKAYALENACKVDEFSRNEIRETFFEASYDRHAFDRLEKCLQKQSFLDSVSYHGYEGALKVLRARYRGGPFKKLHFVSNGTEILNTAIEAEPQNIELRFLRFAVAFHLPPLLQNKKDLKADKSYITKNIEQARKLDLSDQFKQQLLAFMKETGCFSDHEMTHFEQEMQTFI